MRLWRKGMSASISAYHHERVPLPRCCRTSLAQPPASTGKPRLGAAIKIDLIGSWGLWGCQIQRYWNDVIWSYLERDCIRLSPQHHDWAHNFLSAWLTLWHVEQCQLYLLNNFPWICSNMLEIKILFKFRLTA